MNKVRYGKYPESIDYLKVIGEWEKIALNSVKYHPSVYLKSYYVEVELGWMGKPDIEIPEEFWQGTGYDEKLKLKD